MFERAIALRPDYAEAHNNLGTTLQQQGQLDQAVARFEQATRSQARLRRSPQQPGQCSSSCRASSTKRRHASSKRWPCQPDHAEAHNNLGDMLKQQGKLDQAVRTVRASDRPAAGLRRRAQQPRGHPAGPAPTGRSPASLRAAARAAARFARRRNWAWRLAICSKAITSVAGPRTKHGCGCPSWPMPTDLPRWKGEPLAGRSLLLWPSKAWAIRSNSSATPGCSKSRGPGSCWPLSRRSAGCWRRIPTSTSCFFSVPANCRRCDFYLPLLSAPGALGTTPRRFPPRFPTCRPIPS